MSQVKAIDVSVWQGNIDWNAVRSSGVEIGIIKVSGGDAGLYYDSKATTNWLNSKNAGITRGYYHFAGAGNAIAEADFFVKACSPLEQDDVLVLDWEVAAGDPVGWCNTFVTRVHELTGVWPLIYMNASTVRAHDWTPVLKNCGLWVAAWTGNPNIDVNTGGKMYVMQQYTSDGSVPGISGRVDLDMWFGTLEQFKKYGYKAPTPPAPTPTPPPTPVPPVPPVEPPKPVDPPKPTQPPVDTHNDEKINKILELLQTIFNFFQARWATFRDFLKKGK